MIGCSCCGEGKGELGGCWKWFKVPGTCSKLALGSGSNSISGGGVAGSVDDDLDVKREHPRMRFLNSGMLIRLAGSHSKMRLKIKSSSLDKGKIELRNLESLR